MDECKSITEISSFKNFLQVISDSLWSPMSKNSTTLSIISSYLKGQKILYIESKTHCEQKLNSLMVPAILISATCTVLSIGIKNYEYGGLIVSCLAGLNSFILSIISYLKLDAKSEAHKTSSYQFDKLQTMCEFFAGKALLVKDDELVKKVTIFIEDIEKKVEEIKDSNQFIIPEAIRYRYPIVYETNVFVELKRIKTHEKVLKHELSVICNKIDKSVHPVNIDLIHEKDKKIQEILSFRNKYFDIDIKINNEIRDNILKRKSFSICNWMKC